MIFDLTIGIKIVLSCDDWDTERTKVDQHKRLSDFLQCRQAETQERRYQNNRAIEATANARSTYIERQRYTIKTYCKNIKELGTGILPNSRQFQSQSFCNVLTFHNATVGQFLLASLAKKQLRQKNVTIDA